MAVTYFGRYIFVCKNVLAKEIIIPFAYNSSELAPATVHTVI
jgi:hypothetical protein